MGLVIYTQGKLEDDSHLTLLQPVTSIFPGTLEVQIRVPDDVQGPALQPPADWLAKTPQERAAMFEEWTESLPKSAVALSDYAVSRDSIYD